MKKDLINMNIIVYKEDADNLAGHFSSVVIHIKLIIFPSEVFFSSNKTMILNVTRSIYD